MKLEPRPYLCTSSPNLQGITWTVEQQNPLIARERRMGVTIINRRRNHRHCWPSSEVPPSLTVAGDRCRRPRRNKTEVDTQLSNTNMTKNFEAIFLNRFGIFEWILMGERRIQFYVDFHFIASFFSFFWCNSFHLFSATAS